jgi:hypothetical protein
MEATVKMKMKTKMKMHWQWWVLALFCACSSQSTDNAVDDTSAPGSTDNPVSDSLGPGNTDNPVGDTSAPGSTDNPVSDSLGPGNTDNPVSDSDNPATDSGSDTGAANGVLSIIGRKQDMNGAAYTSGRINSHYEVPNTPGTRVEVRAKMGRKRCNDADPFVDGTWPAIWMLGSDATEQNYGGNVVWPGCGEIDINEWLGAWNADHYLTNQWGEPVFRAAHNVPATVPYGADGPEKWHVYGLRFNGDTITFLFNGADQATQTYADAAGHSHRIILNMALGGDLGGAMAADFVSDEIQIDWVRVFDAAGDLLWQDEMNDEATTKANWFPFTGRAYNNELQYYTNWAADNFEWHTDMQRGECL